MGYKSDWLYRLVFDHIRELWQRWNAENDRWNETGRVIVHPELRQPALAQLLVQQIAEADLSKDFLSGTVFRSWQYAGGEFELFPNDAIEGLVVKGNQRVDGLHCRFYREGLIRFYICPDRKMVHFAYQVGPLYGRGYICRVLGQGQKGMLGTPLLRYIS